MSTSRRQFMEQSLAIGFAMGVPFCALPSLARAQSNSDELAKSAVSAGQTEVVIAGAIGAFGDLVQKAFYDPFTEATGIKVIPVASGFSERLAKLQAQYVSGTPREWDMVVLPTDRLSRARPFLRDLGDCSDLPNVIQDAPEGVCLGHAVVTNAGGGVLAYDREVFPSGGPQPASWADFWDVETFPGQRTMPNIGSPWWVLAAALIADGVEQDKLFPLDVDRAFKKLTELKPHIIWWTSGDQSMQLFRSGEVVMGMLFAGRAITLRSQEVDTGIVWQDAPIDAVFWAVTKEAPHPLAAMALLNYFFSRPEAHLELLEFTGESTLFNPLLPMLSDELRQNAAVEPSNWNKLIKPDLDYIAASQEELLSKFNAWLAS